MALSPYKPSVYNFGFAESLDFFQQKGQKFLAVSITNNPWRPHVSVTESTEIDNSLFGDADGNICLGDGTCRAYSTNGRYKLNPTHWA